MSVVPEGIDTEIDLPSTVPLRHFVVSLGCLLAGTVLGVGVVVGLVSGMATLAAVHLLLVGFVCVTIMGAMTQFVPVWSGTSLHSRRLASVQLVLVVAGLTGFAGALVVGVTALLIPFGLLMLAGFWTFAYNVLRTLATLEDYDVTERHFLVALGFFLLLAPLGVLLAVDFTSPVTADLPVGHASLRQAHATVAVFGAVLTTVYGALYQLGPMFTQTDTDSVDDWLQSLETVGHPLGVVFLAGGRLVGSLPLARVGGLVVVVSATAVAVFLGRRLLEMRVDVEPMHARYAVAAVALAGWALLTAPVWLRAPLEGSHLLGATGSIHLLALGVVGTVVLGTLYHIVPFLIWVNRYSDRLGFEPVPMIDDLYSDRIAAVDGILWVSGIALLVVTRLAGLSPTVSAVGAVAVAVGAIAATANLLSVISEHGPEPLDCVLLGPFSPRSMLSWCQHTGERD